MTRTTKILLTTGALALGAAGFAAASQADGGWGRHHGRGHHGELGRGLFEAFDTNGDGTLTQVEIDQARQAKLTEFDANADGSLSLEEYQALWLAAMRTRMVDAFQAHDDDGDGLVTVEEFGERYERIIIRLDVDGDGELTESELPARRHERDGPPHGGPHGGPPDGGPGHGPDGDRG